MTLRAYILLIFMSLGISMQATPVTPSMARQKAEIFFAAWGKQPVQDSNKLNAPNGNASLYIFNADGGGFVIIAGDDAFGDFIGYSYHGAFIPGDVPPGLTDWLDGVSQRVEAARSDIRKAPRHEQHHQPIAPLIGTQWSQGAKDEEGNAYNLLSPVIDGRHCPAGCVAVAMAQVMNYHQWPQEACDAVPGYVNSVGEVTMEALPQLDFAWSDMLPTYDGSESEEQRMAVANLMRYCGQAAKTMYSSDKAEAFAEDAATALKNIFGYASTIRHLKRDNKSEEEWDQTIYKELASSRPVIYFGSSDNGTHCFLCDGYDDGGFYHINWGWGGLYDGYFNLSILVPEEPNEDSPGKDYSYHQHVLTGITANYFSGQTITFHDETVKAICLKQWDINGDGELSLSEAEVVKSLDKAFRNSDITSFDELQYFTGLESISPVDFKGCTSLASITIPENVSRIARGAFTDCPLSHLAVSPENIFFDSRDDCNAIIETASGTLLIGCAATTIPETTKALGEGAFENCTALTSVSLPEGLTIIGVRCFKGCTGLVALTIPTTVTEIQQEAFAYCENISTIHTDQPIPPLTAPDAFEGCTPIVYVPAGAREAYSTAEGWCDLIIEEPQTDNYLYSTDFELRRPIGGKLEISLHNSDMIIGCQGQIHLPEGLSIATDKNGRPMLEPSERLTDHQLHCTRQADGSYIFLIMSMNLEPIADEDGILFSLPLEIADSLEAGTYEISFEQVALSTIDENEEIGGVYPPSFSIMVSLKDFLMGDVDHDRHINVSDVMMIVNRILGKPLAVFYEDEADTDCNDHIDVVDVMRVVQLVIRQSTDSYAPRREGALLMDAGEGCLTLHLDDATRYTAMQARLRTTGTTAITSVSLHDACAATHQLSWGEAPDGSVTMVVYSLGGHPFDHDVTTLVDIKTSDPAASLTVDDILLTTRDLRTVGAGVLTCIDGVEGQATPAAPAYTLSGQRAAKDYKGVVVSKGRKRTGKP